MVSRHLIGLVCSLVLSASVEGGVIWSEDFESGGFTAWSQADPAWTVVNSALSAHSGLRGADVKGNTAPDDDLLRVVIPTTGYQQLELSYWFKIRDGLEAADRVAVEWTADGLLWQPLASYTALPTGDWQLASLVLPLGANNNPLFSLRFVAGLGTTGDRFNVDDVSLVGIAIPEPTTLLLCLLWGGVRGRVRR